MLLHVDTYTLCYIQKCIVSNNAIHFRSVEGIYVQQSNAPLLTMWYKKIFNITLSYRSLQTKIFSIKNIQRHGNHIHKNTTSNHTDYRTQQNFSVRKLDKKYGKISRRTHFKLSNCKIFSEENKILIYVFRKTMHH